jgi:hypothetical protein
MYPRILSPGSTINPNSQNKMIKLLETINIVPANFIHMKKYAAINLYFPFILQKNCIRRRGLG